MNSLRMWSVIFAGSIARFDEHGAIATCQSVCRFQYLITGVTKMHA